MEFTQTVMLEVPLWQMAVLLVIMIACLAWRRYALGMLGAVLFILYWGYIYNMDKFLDASFEFNYVTLCFILTGGINVMLVLILTLHAFSSED
jgi:hypothetical protein